MASQRITRRGFFKAAAAGTLAAGGTFGYTWRIEPHWVEIVHRKLPINNLPQAMAGKRLIQLSDIHVGPIVDDDFLIRSLRTVNDLQPDLIAITGDLMSCRGSEQVEHTASILKHLDRANTPTVVVPGNHDYGRRWSRSNVADRLAERLRGIGMTVLRNETCEIGGLRFVGLDDLWSPNFGPERVLAEADPAAPNLVLCHNPDVADHPVWGEYRGWMLCGHTHGGQCSAPFLGPPILPVRNRRYVEGEIDLYDGRMMYINRGLGYVRRVRFNARPEITVFELTPSAPA